MGPLAKQITHFIMSAPIHCDRAIIVRAELNFGTFDSILLLQVPEQRAAKCKLALICPCHNLRVQKKQRVAPILLLSGVCLLQRVLTV